ncbi:MAG: MBL fold metallo-hydrolase [Acidimicrobiia bacterium]|nr:MBL fold metallo-hydrolase [Acidimicrobiia bacterium]
METNVPGVHEVPGMSRCYVVDGDQGVTLIDTGMPRRAGKVAEVLARIGRSITDVNTIAITHSHPDHVGNAAALKIAAQAVVLASPADSPAIRGETPTTPPPLFGRLPFLRPLFRLVPKAAPVDVDRMIDETSAAGLPEDLRVIDTPGHTPGHVSYLLDRAGGVLFAGDAAVATRNGEIKRGYFNAPLDAIDESIRHVAEFDFEVAFFAHSPGIERGARAAFQRFVEVLDD